MIKSFSKINLSLRVVGKMMNGLHNIQSNNVLIDLHDKIKITKIKTRRDHIIFKGPFIKHINKKKNSITETLKILRKNELINSNYKVVINKKIPVFSGLGGGTSNSAFLLKFFLKNHINEDLLKKIEKKVGSDLRIFFQKQSFQKKLCDLQAYKKNFCLYLVLISPKIKCSTEKIYSNVKKYTKLSKINFCNIEEKNLFIDKIIKEKNDLENVVIKKFSIIKKILESIKLQNGCYLARMTGSGSVCYGLFNNQKASKAALNILKKKFPNYWCVVSKTI